MKFKPFYFVVFIFTFFLAADVSAQIDRRVGSSQYKRDRKKPENKDFVEVSASYLAKELKLDDFQKAAVKVVLEEERQSITAVNEAQGITMDERKDKARAISGRLYKKILPLLSEEQAEKYSKMEESKKF